MEEESSKLLEGLMNVLGDHPEEKLSQILKSLTDSSGEGEEGTDDSPSVEGGEMLMKLGGMMGGLNGGGTDERSALLTALRPFLSESRRPGVDQALKFLRLSKLAKTAKDLDLLNQLF